MSLKALAAGLCASALIAAPIAALAQAMPSAPIPYSQLNDKSDANGKVQHKHMHHHAKKAQATTQGDGLAADQGSAPQTSSTSNH